MVPEKDNNYLIENINGRPFFSVVLFINRFLKLISVTVFLLVLLIGYFLFINGQYQRFNQSKNTRLSGLLDTASGLKTADENYGAVVGKNISLTEEEKELLSLALPEKFNLASLLIQLSSLATKNGFWINNISYEDLGVIFNKAKIVSKSSERVSNLQKVNIKLSVIGGDYNKLKNLLKDLEQSLMIFDVVSLDFKSLGQLANGFDLNLVTYYFSDVR